jgi:hypothetical protein
LENFSDEASNKKNKDSQTPHTICKEHILTVNVVMYLRKNFFLLDEFNEKLGKLLSSGIVSHIINRYVDLRYWNVKKTDKGE